MVFSVRYEVSEEDRRKVVDGTYVVESDDETFRGLAEALAANYEDATKEAVDFSKIFLVEKQPGGEVRKQEVTGQSLDASLTYDLMSDEIWVVVKRSRGRASFELDRSSQKKDDGAVFSVKYSVSKEDKQRIVDGVYKVTSDDVTFKGLADALLALYEQATNERVEFSNFFLVEKQSAAADKMYEVKDGSLLGSLTYDLMSDEVWVVVKSCT